jgi:hypothetical protein
LPPTKRGRNVSNLCKFWAEATISFQEEEVEEEEEEKEENNRVVTFRQTFIIPTL